MSARRDYRIREGICGWTIHDFGDGVQGEARAYSNTADMLNGLAELLNDKIYIGAFGQRYRVPDSYVPTPAADGWIEWKGGENPAPGKMVDVDQRDGNGWRFRDSKLLLWKHLAHPGHEIIRYRIVGDAP